ncbi:hypothetical protein ACLI1A_11680 [Flavobacterium sp. RHBU_3]|uniref:hypothetical protein n=1 Tax=Flavobacterium sp. RHBU_3 TaxID=3391184 RepID=UPI003984AAF7
MINSISTILGWFKAGKKPTEQQYADSWQSFWHKEEIIPQSTIENLEQDFSLKTSNQDFLAHLSDPQAHIDLFKSMQEESYKIIDAQVSGGVYTVTADDFGKTLRYNGTGEITIVLSTVVPSVVGNQFKIYQACTGKITFSVNGYLLRYGNDVVPKLYGTYSTAVIEVTDVSPATVYMYGKLELA